MEDKIYLRNGVWVFEKDGKRHKFVDKGAAERAYARAFPPKPAPKPAPKAPAKPAPAPKPTVQ